MKTRFKTKLFWLLLVIVLVSTVFYFKPKANSALNENGSTVTKQDVVQRVTISGTVQPRRKAIITSPYKGYIRKLFVKLGAQIQQNDPVVSVTTSLSSVEQVFPLRAPFSGRVVQVQKSEGEYVKDDVGDFIVRIDDLGKLYIDANAPELDRVKMKIGQEAIIKASAILDKTYKAVVKDLSFAAKETDKWQRSSVVEFPVRLEILDPDDRINPGMSVLIDIVTQKKENVLALRHEFIGREKTQFFVTLQSGERRNVTLGLQNEELSEISGGLVEGDLVRKVDFAQLEEKQ